MASAKYTVRITMAPLDEEGGGEGEQFFWHEEDAPVGKNNSLPCESFELAKEWAATALDGLPGIETAEPMLVPLDRASVLARWDNAVTKFGEQESFQLVWGLLTQRESPSLREIIGELELHPGFQLLRRGKDQPGQWIVNEVMRGQYKDVPETDIRALDAAGQMKYLMRRIMATLAHRNNIAPLTEYSNHNAWVAVLAKVGEVYLVSTERRQPALEARRQTHRLERLSGSR